MSQEIPQETPLESSDYIIEDDALSGKDTISSLREKLALCQKERDEHLIGWQRARADHVNFKRVSEEETARKVKLSITPMVKDLAEILDAFDSAIKIEQQSDTASGSNSDTSIREGIIQLQSKFLQILTKYGISLIDPMGEEFDPHRHEAVGTQTTEVADDDHLVAKVIQKGLELEGILIRPAKVILFVTS